MQRKLSKPVSCCNRTCCYLTRLSKIVTDFFGTAYEVRGRVMFPPVSVILFTGQEEGEEGLHNPQVREVVTQNCTDHVWSTREGIVFTRIYDSVHREGVPVSTLGQGGRSPNWLVVATELIVHTGTYHYGCWDQDGLDPVLFCPYRPWLDSPFCCSPLEPQLKPWPIRLLTSVGARKRLNVWILVQFTASWPLHTELYWNWEWFLPATFEVRGKVTFSVCLCTRWYPLVSQQACSQEVEVPPVRPSPGGTP